MANRGRDAADIFTATVGAGFGGFKAKAGPVQAGLMSEGIYVSFYGEKTCETPKGGLRGGDWLNESSNEKKFAGFETNIDTQYFVYGMEIFGGGETANERGKTRIGFTILMLTFPLPEDSFYRIPKEENYEYAKFSALPYFFDIELALGFGYIFRIGLNPAELIDFLLGLTTIDIFGDDIVKKTDN